MTCIVGLSTAEGVWIGADSAAVAGLEVRATSLPKVFRVGEFIIGYTSSFRMGQILQHHLEIKPQGEESDMEYMVRSFAESVRKALKDKGFMVVKDSQEEGGTFLAGYNGQLYEVNSDLQVNQYRDGLAAVGCGGAYAFGALYVSVSDSLSPETCIQRALETAAYFSGGVIPPFTVEYQARR